MRWSELFGKKSAHGPTLEPVWDESLLLELVSIISGGDDAAVSEVRHCLKDVPEHFSRRSLRFRQQVQWLALVDILEAGGHLCVRDWKSIEREAFESALNALTGMKRLGLAIHPQLLEDNGGIAEWCGLLDEEWKEKQCCMAAMETYGGWALFPCKLDDFNDLSGLAVWLGKGTCLGRKLKL